jgi:hypothetical protein
VVNLTLASPGVRARAIHALWRWRRRQRAERCPAAPRPVDALAWEAGDP